MPHNVQDNDGNGRPDWWTPRPLAATIVKRFAINFDAFADHENTVVDTFATVTGTYTKGPAVSPDLPALGRVLRWISDDDGFAASWEGRRVFLNPPYSRGFLPQVAEKIIAERQRAEIIVGLFMADTSTKFWREFILDREHVEGITYLPRVNYTLAPAALEAFKAEHFGNGPSSPNFGSAVVVFRGADYPIR